MTLAIGRAVLWLTVVMVLLQALVVVLRYVFSIGFVPLQEAIWYMHGLVFLFGAGFALLKNAHVRVDIFYREARPKTKALVDLAGCILFLLPFCILTFWLAVPYVATSWSVLERSREVGGLPGIFLLKTAILLFAALLGAQALSLAIRCVSRLAPAGWRSGHAGV